MKFAKRIMLGFLGTAALTSFILSALNAYSDQAALHSAMQTNSNTADKTALSDEAGLHAKDETLSIGTSERHMLYQPQDTPSSQTAGTDAAQPKAAPSDAAQSGQEKPASPNTELSSQNHTASSKSAESGQKDDPSPKSAESGQEKNPSSKSAESGQGKASSSKQQDTKDSGRNTFQTVTRDYFSDALFIGDSRTVGMLQSHLLPEASYYAKTGIGIGGILSKPIVNEGGRMISVKDALSLHSFGKVYIMIGINDIAAGDADWFTQQYKNILETIRETQPDAVIYIQGNIPMSYGTQDLNGALNNKNLSIRNEASRTLADKETIFYLEIDKIYADANGNLQSDYTTDGLHVSSDYYPLWVDYLLHHAIVH